MDNNRMFVNPYNFVPLGNSLQRNTPSSESDLITGDISCTLKIKTPLAIPDTDFTSGNESDYYDFMSVNGIKIIPGSEIRGMIRNIYETVTDSCLSVVNSNVITKRGTSAFSEKGLLQWDGNEWNLYNARWTPTYSNTTLSRKKHSLENKKYVIRNWSFFTGLNLVNLKKKVNEAIVSSKNFCEFKENLKADKWFVISNGNINDTESITLAKGNSKGINITRKWGDHYSRSALNNIFGSEELEKKYTECSKCQSFFEPDFSAAPLTVSEETIDNLIEVLASYEFYTPKNKYLYDAVTPKKDGEMYPVFYTVEGNGKLRLAPAQMSRVAFSKTVRKLLGDYAPCDDITKLCPGCKLFGTVIKGGAKATKVRFSDATELDNVTLSDNYIPLKVLSSPKVTSIEFYSTPSQLESFENVNKWNYDSNGVTLRGRKFYLHNPKAASDPSVYSEPEAVHSASGSSLNASFKLATEGEFFFKIFFDRISKDELQALVWSLTLGNTDGSEKYCHKLGHGKPLGLGSVVINVNKINERKAPTESNGYEYKVEPIDKCELMHGYKLPIESTATLAALQTICDYSYAEGENVAYPLGRKNNNENSMLWFTENHGGVGRREPFKHVLHPVVDKDGNAYEASELRLPYLVSGGQAQPAAHQRGGNNSQNNNNNRNNNQQHTASSAAQSQSGEMKDKTIKCKDCGEDFILTVGEQEFYIKTGMNEPKRCKRCRDARKNKRGN